MNEGPEIHVGDFVLRERNQGVPKSQIESLNAQPEDDLKCTSVFRDVGTSWMTSAVNRLSPKNCFSSCFTNTLEKTIEKQTENPLN